MSKRNRRQQQHTHLVESKRNLAREQEILHRPADPDDPIIRALMTRLSAPDCTEVEAVRIGLALQQMIRGEASLLSNMNDPKVAETVNKIIEQRAKLDEAAAKFEDDKLTFAYDVPNKAEQIAPVGERRNAAIANGMNEYQKQLQIGQAKQAERRLRLEYRLKNDPKVLVDVVPQWERRVVNGAVGEVEVPTVIRIMNRQFVLKSGSQMLPKILADQYMRIRRGQLENQERRSLMAKNMNAQDLEQKMAGVDEKYGTKHNGLFVPGEF